MNDAHIEAGFQNTLAEQLAESVWRELRPLMMPPTYPMTHLVAHTIVERMRRAGISEATIARVVRS